MSISGESRSASMSQSESEAEFETTDSKPMFPYEKLYYSARDKSEIEAKPEIEREAILAERNEQVEKHEQNAQLRRMLSARAKEEAKQAAKKMRKASTADLDDSQRKSSRQRTKIGGGKAGEANSAIAAYKKQREEKNLRAEERRNRTTERRVDRRDDFSDADGDAESDNDYDDRDRRHTRPRPRSPSPHKDDPPVELADIQRVRVGRENFAQVCWTPGFEDTLTGCYARVCLGPGRTQGQNEYRLCLIKGFQEGKPYAIMGSTGKSFLINKYIIAAHGKATKPWSFLECSNSRFTDDEWRRYRLTMANEDCRMPTRGLVNAKLGQINKLISHRFTDAEISTKLRRQKELEDMVNRTAEKKEIKEQIFEAEQRDDEEAIKELEDKLLNLVPMKLAMGTSLHPNLTAKAAAATDRIAELNKQNQRRAQENMQKAALLKRRMIKKKEMDTNKLAPPKTLDDDLFGSASDISRAGTPVNGTAISEIGSRAGTPLATVAAHESSNLSRGSTPTIMRTGGEVKRGLPVIKKSKRDDEVLQGLDLGIDIDI